jgi:hypothetical protein
LRTVEFRLLLDDRNALRVRFETDRDRGNRFVVQLECRFDDDWSPIIRYDTAHEFAHVDVLHPTGETDKIKLEDQNYNEVLTFAINDLTDNWKKYRERYEKWLEKK